jgi:hypothetical protein
MLQTYKVSINDELWKRAPWKKGHPLRGLGEAKQDQSVVVRAAS